MLPVDAGLSFDAGIVNFGGCRTCKMQSCGCLICEVLSCGCLTCEVGGHGGRSRAEADAQRSGVLTSLLRPVAVIAIAVVTSLLRLSLLLLLLLLPPPPPPPPPIAVVAVLSCCCSDVFGYR